MIIFQGMCLNFDCVVVMLLVIRNLITQLRKIGLASILPLDENIAVHKHVGYIIFFNAIVHTGGHFANFCKLSSMIMDILLEYTIFVLEKHFNPKLFLIDFSRREYSSCQRTRRI